MSPDMTILVKKKDGTEVRMTWTEFKTYQASLGLEKQNQKIKEQIEIKNKVEVEPVVSNTNLPVVEGTMALAVDAPVRDIFVDEAMANEIQQNNRTTEQHYNIKTQQPISVTVEKRMVDVAKNVLTTEDHRSPLEDNNNDIKRMPGQDSLPDQKHDVFSRVVKSLSFGVADELQSRLRSLVLSRVKDIRNDSQVEDYATRPKDNGGLGLLPEEAKELLIVIQEAVGVNKKEKSNSLLVKEKNNLVGLSDIENNEDTNKKNIISPIKNINGEKMVLHDVTVPTKNTLEVVEIKTNVGPIEELETFSLVDLRRLANDPAYGSEILLKKIINLKKDGYPIFLRGVQAWYNSPLYLQYQSIIKEAIDQGVEIKQILSSKSQNQISADEFFSLVEMGKHLNT